MSLESYLRAKTDWVSLAQEVATGSASSESGGRTSTVRFLEGRSAFVGRRVGYSFALAPAEPTRLCTR